MKCRGRSFVALGTLLAAGAMRLGALEQVLVKASILSVPPEVAVTLADIETGKQQRMNEVKILMEPQVLAIEGKEAQIDVTTELKVKDSKTEQLKQTKVGFMLSVTVNVGDTGTISYATNYLFRAAKGKLRFEGMREDELFEIKVGFEGACRSGDALLIKAHTLDSKGNVQYLYMRFHRIAPKVKPPERI